MNNFTPIQAEGLKDDDVLISYTIQHNNKPIGLDFIIGSKEELAQKTKEELKNYLWDYSIAIGVSVRLGLYTMFGLDEA